MSLSVVVISTGGVGAHALRAVLRNPRYDLTGVWVSSDEKAGKDTGELAGLGAATGIVATTDLANHAVEHSWCSVRSAVGWRPCTSVAHEDQRYRVGDRRCRAEPPG